jgi:hypothetical protein
MSKGCPPVEIELGEVVQAVRKEIFPKGHEVVKESVNVAAIQGLGKISLVEPRIDPSNFVLGYVTLPSVINFATKLMQVGIVFPQVDLALSRSLATGATLVGTLISGGKSFLLGAFLGQFPSTLDALADVAIAAIAKGRMKPAPGAPPASTSSMVTSLTGLGAEEAELRKLRADLERLSGGGMGLNPAEELAGSEMVIR